jgi:hypothetical protein
VLRNQKTIKAIKKALRAHPQGVESGRVSQRQYDKLANAGPDVPTERLSGQLWAIARPPVTLLIVDTPEAADWVIRWRRV